jgi:hypothetical protein
VTSPRPDTRFLATSPITTDLGQRLTNLTVAAPGGYEANSVRTAIDGQVAGRSIEIKVEINSTNGGVLVDHATGNSYRIAVAVGGAVEFSDSSGLLKSIPAPNVGVGLKDYVVSWSTEPNPQSTGGAGTILRSEFVVYDVAGAALSWDVLIHDNVVTSAAGTFTVGGVYTGGMMTLTYANPIDAVRVSSRFHSRIETREHFVAQTAAPTLEGPAACQLFPLPAAVCTNGNVIGPQYQLAAASMQTGRNRHRLASPLVQWQNASPPALSDNMKEAANVNPKHVWNMPGGEGWQQPLMWLCARRVPLNIMWLRVEVQWATWETISGDTDLVELRAHTWSGNPLTATETHSVLISRQVDDGTNGLGVRQVFDPLLVKRDPANGLTWIGLSARTDAGSGTGNATYWVRSLTVVPWVLPEGYGAQPLNPYGP